jgi:ribosome-binding protein aMBF1 (putative translation factor)
MRCTVCKKSCEEVELYDGILEDGMVMVCSICAEEESIPIIKKPSTNQLSKANKRYTVRERMERMSGFQDSTDISEDQIITQRNLAKLKMPEPKQKHIDVLDNYYWTLNMSRRRKKMTITHLAEKMHVNSSIIEDIEKGRLPDNFKEIFMKLEAYLGIKLLKNQEPKINFTRNIDEEKQILEEVKRKMSVISVEEPEDEIVSEIKEIKLEKKKEKLNKLSKGEIDLSKRQALQDVTLNDLVEMKRKKEKTKIKIKEESMIGDDIDIDISEL